VDSNGKSYLESLKNRGIHTDSILKSKTHTGECICLITPDGERTMNTYLGASQEISIEDLDPNVKTFH
jgi:sugar/nucleoside kinase (ribokinase family)